MLKDKLSGISHTLCEECGNSISIHAPICSKRKSLTDVRRIPPPNMISTRSKEERLVEFAKALYQLMADKHPMLPADFPSWDRLSDYKRYQWIEKVRLLPNG